MFPILQIGSLAIQTPGLILLIGIWIGLELAERQARRFDLLPNQIFTVVLAALGGGLVGGRLVFAAGNPQVFYENPLNLFALSSQLISPAGGLFFTAAAGIAYGRRAGLPLWPTLDCVTVTLAVLQISIGLANFASGDAYGLPSGLPWAIFLWGATRHPTQVYETLSAAIVFAVTWPGFLKGFSGLFAHAGARFWLFLALSSAWRLFLEAFRADSPLLFDQFRQAQFVAWVLLALSLWQIAARLLSPPLHSQQPQ